MAIAVDVNAFERLGQIIANDVIRPKCYEEIVISARADQHLIDAVRRSREKQ
jgi:hypothetical protein